MATPEMLKQLREIGCPWDEKTCAFAAKAATRCWWACENGCPDAETLLSAVTNEHYDG